MTPCKGPEKPLFELKNLGIMSIPPGFVAATIDSPLLRERCAEDLWSDVHARRNTRRPTSKATAHLEAARGSEIHFYGGG